MFEVQIKTELPESCALATFHEIMKDVVMKVEGLTKIDKNVKGLLRIKAKKVENIILNLPSYCESVTLSSREAKVLIKEHTCLVALPILESGCIITNVEIENNNVIWSVICDDESFLNLLSNLDHVGINFDILYKGKPNDKSKITYREEEILKIALKKGFFDIPRKIKLEKLAEEIGISVATLSEILRRGQKKILEKYFKS